MKKGFREKLCASVGSAAGLMGSSPALLGKGVITTGVFSERDREKQAGEHANLPGTLGLRGKQPLEVSEREKLL